MYIIRNYIFCRQIRQENILLLERDADAGDELTKVSFCEERQVALKMPVPLKQDSKFSFLQTSSVSQVLLQDCLVH